MTNTLPIFRRLAILAASYLAALSLSRLLLVGLLAERVGDTGGLGFILLQGVRFDLILLGLVFGPVALVLPWLHTTRLLLPVRRWLVPACLGLFSAVAFFVEASTWSFIGQFDSRPNYIFVEYLVYPKEVLSTVLAEKPFEMAIFTLVAFLIAGWVFHWLRTDPESDRRISLSAAVVATPLVIILSVAMVRSTLDHRPVNPSIAAFSEDSMVNQLPLNSPYTVLYAIYERQRDSDRNRIRYGEMEEDEVLDIVMAEAGISVADQVDLGAPTLRKQVATRPSERPLNLVIILQESLGAYFVGSLGGKDLTPNIDRLGDEGIFFDRLYATGTRSVRGIEAVLTCITPRPQLSVVKLGETQQNFFTLASLLERQGYQTSFIYGGESHFDNMRQFFLGNGFQTVVDEDDYVDPVFVGSWGVSDEDLLSRAHEAFEQAGDQPFFSLVFSSSNHSPYEIPEGRVEESPHGPQATAIRYADYAVGEFFDKARESSYWDNTVFVIVADHSVHVDGGKLVPLKRFHIPGVIVGSSVEPRRIPRISSQIDLLPTLLSLIGVSAAHPCVGRDLTLPQYSAGAGRASMQLGELQAYAEGDRMVVLQHDLEPMTFSVDPEGEMTLLPDGDAELERRALAYALWGPMTIRNNAYYNYPDELRHAQNAPEQAIENHPN